jgi:hypothetical protein
MKNKLVPHGTNDIIIPELEEAAENYKPKLVWTETDLAVLKKYYGKVSTARLAAYLHRTGTSVQQKAVLMNLKVRGA